nr:TetR/AcrR family transcriptional regulator [Pseudomonas cavernicola]
MRPLKIPRDELLQRCANTFKRLGYHGTTMDALSSACGLTKASFYHHYPNKESLLRDVLDWTHERLKQSLFSIAFDEDLAPHERLTSMGRKAKKLFQDDSIGCLMGVVAVDATYGKVELMEPIRRFLDDWTAAFAKLYSAGYSQEEAQRLARQLVADFEGLSCWLVSTAIRAT